MDNMIGRKTKRPIGNILVRWSITVRFTLCSCKDKTFVKVVNNSLHATAVIYQILYNNNTLYDSQRAALVVLRNNSDQTKEYRYNR